MSDYVIFSLGNRVSLCPSIGDAAPLGGGVTFGFAARDWRHTLGSLPFYQSTGRFVRKVVLHKMENAMDV